jgi:hypothetical protein
MIANGYLRADELTVVQGGIRLAHATAAKWAVLVDRAQDRFGITLRITAPYGGYRSIEDQWAMWRDRSTSTTGVVAYPGTSVHGFGRAIDIDNWGSLGSARLDALAADLGLVRNIAGERWHYQDVTAGGGFAGHTPTPITEEDEEDDMYAPKVIFRTEGTPEWSLVAPHLAGASAAERGYLVTADRSVGEAWARLYAAGFGAEHARVNRAGYIALQAAARVLHEQWARAFPITPK